MLLQHSLPTLTLIGVRGRIKPVLGCILKENIIFMSKIVRECLKIVPHSIYIFRHVGVIFDKVF